MSGEQVTELNRFEIARIIGARSLQLSLGAPPLIPVPPKMIDPLDLAREEFRQGVIPLMVIRG
ncbi:MAG: DNA-directed RNA polymerase subunit K [Candidatus Micrarchaeota archaeon]|nr:DNA-directed RNA polymerase subunit K [Candidatus Micrarchaeota archaeon]